MEEILKQSAEDVSGLLLTAYTKTQEKKKEIKNEMYKRKGRII